MIIKKKIYFICGNVIYTKGKEIQVLDLKSELSSEAFKEYKKFNSVCYNGYLYSEKHINSGGYIGEAEIENARYRCKCIRIVGSSEWFTNGCPIHELNSKK